MDLQANHDLKERTVDDDGVVYIKDNYIQVAFDGQPNIETYTYLTPADAQQAFDNLTQGWYQKGPRANNPYDRDLKRKHAQKRCDRCGEWHTELYLVPEKFWDIVGAPNRFKLCKKCDKSPELEQWLIEQMRLRERNSSDDDDEEVVDAIHDQYLAIGHDEGGVLWWYQDGKLQTVVDKRGSMQHSDMDDGQDVPRGRYDPNTHCFVHYSWWQGYTAIYFGRTRS